MATAKFHWMPAFGFWCSCMNPMAWPNSWRINRRNSSSRVSAGENPSDIECDCPGGGLSDSVPSSDEKLLGIEKVIRIWAWLGLVTNSNWTSAASVQCFTWVRTRSWKSGRPSRKATLSRAPRPQVAPGLVKASWSGLSGTAGSPTGTWPSVTGPLTSSPRARRPSPNSAGSDWLWIGETKLATQARLWPRSSAARVTARAATAPARAAFALPLRLATTVAPGEWPAPAASLFELRVVLDVRQPLLDLLQVDVRELQQLLVDLVEPVGDVGRELQRVHLGVQV